MRVNEENNSMDMEARDINYILPAYITNYLYLSKNKLPDKIVFPMFTSVNVTGADRKVVTLPIEWVPPLDPIATDIAKDGEEVSEISPDKEAEINEKEDEVTTLKKRIAELENTAQAATDEAADSQLEIDTAPAPAPEDLVRQQEEYEAEHGSTPRIPGGSVSPAKAAFTEQPDRKPKQPPGGDIGPGSSLSDNAPRDTRDQIRTAKDLVEEPEIAGAAEKPFEKEISRGADGKPVVEDNPSAAN